MNEHIEHNIMCITIKSPTQGPTMSWDNKSFSLNASSVNKEESKHDQRKHTTPPSAFHHPSSCNGCLCDKGSLDLGSSTGEHGWNSRSRHGVRSQSLVDIDQDTGISWLVKSSSLGASAWNRSARAGDLEVDALWVGLSTVALTSAVKGDDLVTEDIATWLEVLWNSNNTGVVVGDQVVSGPCTWV